MLQFHQSAGPVALLRAGSGQLGGWRAGVGFCVAEHFNYLYACLSPPQLGWGVARRAGACMCARAIRVGAQQQKGEGLGGVITLDCAQLSFFSCRTRTKLQMAEPKAAPSDALSDLQTLGVASGEVERDTDNPLPSWQLSFTVSLNTFSTD